LWVDLTHWYYGVYHEPFEPVSAFIFRHSSEWQEAAGKDGLVWATETGSLPKASLPSLFFASSELIGARTLPLAQRLRIIRWVNRLWLEIAFSGHAPTSRAGLALPISLGSVDAKVMDTLKQQLRFSLEFTNVPPSRPKTIKHSFQWASEDISVVYQTSAPFAPASQGASGAEGEE
jgi:hypothetical protein